MAVDATDEFRIGLQRSLIGIAQLSSTTNELQRSAMSEVVVSIIRIKFGKIV